jgi:hypothetical protein
VWWISSILGLQQGLVINIDNLKAQKNISKHEIGIESAPPGVHPNRVLNLRGSEDSQYTSDGDLISTTENDIHNEVIDNCEAFLKQSKEERKDIGRMTRKTSRAIKRKGKKPIKTYGTQTEGIDGSELRRRKAAGECHRCAWPRDRKGGHKTLDCFRWKRLEKGTAPLPKEKRYNK